MSKISFNNKQTDFTIALKKSVEDYFSSRNIKTTGNGNRNCYSSYNLLVAPFYTTCCVDQSSALRNIRNQSCNYRF